MGENTVVHPYNGRLLSNKEEGTVDTCNTWMNLKCITLNGSQTQQAAYCMLPFIWHLGKTKATELEDRTVVQGGKGHTTKGQQEGIFRVMELFCILIVVVDK